MIVRDSYTAETIVSDLFFHLWEMGKRIDIKGEIRPYLVTAVRNRCRNYLELNFVNRENALPAEDSLDIIAQEEPSGILLQRELDEEINRAIAALPEKTKEVFTKSRFEEKTYAQIAEELGISVNTVKYHIGNALSDLSFALGKYLG